MPETVNISITKETFDHLFSILDIEGSTFDDVLQACILAYIEKQEKALNIQVA